MRHAHWHQKTTKIAMGFFRDGFSRERVGTYPTMVSYNSQSRITYKFQLLYSLYQGIANKPPVKLTSADFEQRLHFFKNLGQFLDFGL